MSAPPPEGAPQEWAPAIRTMIRGEAGRLRGTARYRLGAMVLDVLKRPWRLPRLVRLARELLASGGLRTLPELRPPYPVPRSEDSPPRFSGVDGSLQAALEEVRALARSREYFVGEWLLLCLADPRHLPHLRRLPAAEDGPNEVPKPSVRAVEVAIQPREPPGLRAVGPAWILEMLAQEGVAELGRVEGEPGALLVCADGSDAGLDLQGAARAAAEHGRSVAVWWLDSTPVPPELSALGKRLYVADQRLAGSPVRGDHGALHLPPAIQPRLHNPIGWWTGRPDLGITARHERDLPDAWQRLVSVARGGETQLSPEEQMAFLGEPTPDRPPPTWADAAWARDSVRQARLRQVLRRACLSRRVARVLEGLGADAPAEPEPVSVLVCTNRPHYLENVLASFERQSQSPKELVLVLHGDAFDRARVESSVRRCTSPVQVLHAAGSLTLGEALQLGSEAASATIVCRMDDDDWYGAHYVRDMTAALSFSEAAIVTKGTFVLRVERTGRLYLCRPGHEYRYASLGCSGCRMAFRREILAHVGWRATTLAEDAWLGRDCLAHGLPVLVVDRFNFAYHRRAPREHTAVENVDGAWHSGAVALPVEARLEDLE